MDIQKMLREMGAQEVGIGGMQGMAVDGMQFLKLLAQLQEQVAHLTAENADMREIISSGVYVEDMEDAPVTPQYPVDFYEYGANVASYNPSDEEVQGMIDELYSIVLGDGGFFEITSGNTVVTKSLSGGVTKYIVAKGYQEFIEDVEPEAKCECDDTQECYEYGCQQK
jgi:hypothetical protein